MTRPDEMLSRARALQARGDLEDALNLLQFGHSTYPGDFAIALARCTLLRRTNRLDEYRTALSELHAIHPTRPGVLVELASEAQLRGDNQEAARHLDDALLRDPEHRGAQMARAGLIAETTLERAKKLQAAGQADQALAELDAAANVDPTPYPILLARLRLLRQLGRGQEYHAAMSELEARHGEKPGTQVELATGARLAHDYRKARIHLDAALSAQRNHRGARLNQVDLAEAQANHDQALRILDAIRGDGDDPAIERRRGIVLRELGRLTESRDLLAALHQRDPESSETLRQFIRTVLMLDLNAAEPLLEKLRALEPESPLTCMTEIHAARVSRNAELATKLAENAARAWPDHPGVMLERVQVSFLLSDFLGALGILDGIAKDGMGDVPARMARGSALMALAEYDKAYRVFTSILEDSGLHVGAQTGCIRAAAKSDDVIGGGAKAIVEMSALIDHWEAVHGHQNTIRFRAEIARSIGNWEALNELAAAWSDDQPLDIRAGILHSLAIFGTGDPAGAWNRLQECLEHNPHDHTAILLEEQLMLALGRGQVHLNRRVQELDASAPRHMDRQIETVRDLFQLDRAAEARDALQSCNASNGGVPNQELAYELELQGLHEQAKPLWKNADQKNKGAVPGLTTGLQLARMLDFESGLSSYPDMPEAGVHLAYRLSGEPGDFLGWQRRALQASEAYRELSQRPVTAKDLREFVDVPDLGQLLAPAREGKSVLLVSSHFGPLVHNVLLEQLPSLHTLMMRGPQDVPPSPEMGSWTMFEGEASKAAASLFRVLRKGTCIMTMPDVQASYSRRGFPGARACGELFGVPCEIVDTVPKLSQELGLASFWVQPIWSEGRIRIDIRAMPSPQPDEERQTWYDRWAQTYLDHVAEIMTSSPENQNFRAPIWRFLLLRANDVKVLPSRE